MCDSLMYGSVCMHMCDTHILVHVCGLVCVFYTCEHMSACPCALNARAEHQVSYCLETGPLTELEAHCLGQRVLRSCLTLPLKAGVTSACWHILLFIWVLRIQIPYSCSFTQHTL